MKKLIALLPVVFGLLASHSQAGQPVVSPGKESKEYKQVPEETCFNDRELQFDIFGQYSVGEGPNHAGVMRDHGWGGGIGINYFFMRYVGIGGDAAWLDVKEAPGFHHNDLHDDHNSDLHSTTLHNFTGSVILRYPIDHLCLAPYIYGGGGCEVDGLQWASGHCGVGVEYRIKPHRCGVFLDSRWTFLGDRDGHHDLNFFSARAGFRWVF
jgi:hypothetical protein